MDTIKCIRIVNISESIIDINFSWNSGRGQEYFSLMHSMMLSFDCGDYGIPYSSQVSVEIKNGSETHRHDFIYSSRSDKKGQIMVEPAKNVTVPINEEDDYGQLRSLKNISINNDLHERVTVHFSWNSGKREYTLYNTSVMTIPCDEIPNNSRVDVNIVHARKKAHMWFVHGSVKETAQLTLVDRGSGMLVYTQYQSN
jgi:hypothetical protein